jgi:hypothetical protein
MPTAIHWRTSIHLGSIRSTPELPYWWPKVELPSSQIFFGQALLNPSQEAVARGALLRMEQGVTGGKSAIELATHVSKLETARERAMNLQRAIEAASGKKARDSVVQELDNLLRQIRGHEKEIWQKWPDVAKLVCP